MWTLAKSSPSSPKNPGAKPNQRQRKTENKLPVMISSKSPFISKSTDPPLPSSYPCPPGPDSHTQPFPSYSHSPYNDPYYHFHYSSTATPYYLPPTPYYPPPMQMSPPQIQHNHNPSVTGLVIITPHYSAFSTSILISTEAFWRLIMTCLRV